MRSRHVLSITDLSPEEVSCLCTRALRIKRARTDPETLRGKVIGVYFRKTSTRTRTAFMVGAGRLGATMIYYGPHDLQTNTGESLEDTARVLAGYLDVLVMRTSESVAEMEAFAEYPTMSVVNALSEDEHPTQALADLTTILEHFGRLEGIHVVYVGEGNRTAAALALALGRIKDARLTVATPPGYGIDPEMLSRARSLAAAHGAVIEQQYSVEGLPRADVVYTSRWQEMGVSKSDPDWRRRFLPFRVTRELVAQVSKPSGTVFMHDLPAIRGDDVEDEVLDGPESLAWVQAENKLYSAMSVLEWCAVGMVNGG